METFKGETIEMVFADKRDRLEVSVSLADIREQTIIKQEKEIERLREENSKLKKEKELAVWGLRGKLFKIANHDTLNGEKYNNYQWAYEGVVEFAQMALQEIKDKK